MIHKWSSKPPEHNALRLRNNQRRHRARVKRKTEDLETLLSETQSRLDQALVQISRLTAELERLRQPVRIDASHDACVLEARNCEEDALGGEIASMDDAVAMGLDRCLSVECRSHENAQEPSATLVHDADHHGSDTITCHVQDDGGYRRDEAPGEEQDLPLPRPGESTTSCKAAYQMIRQHACGDFDLLDLWRSLQPMFRCAVKEGQGCQVENQALFKMLDFVTSTIERNGRSPLEV
ncbi:hypothetical protein BJ170DRAFT_646421 [Xylariales sp. AK1849]|nr:hypothetical protein BJ170DRAFT_646421 [Xylariales sp. AK1849]